MPVLVGTLMAAALPGQELQFLQLVALQSPQELPVPATEATKPESSLENTAQAETVRAAICSQRGQTAASSAWRKERNSSNFISHSGQIYS